MKSWPLPGLLLAGVFVLQGIALPEDAYIRAPLTVAQTAMMVAHLLAGVLYVWMVVRVRKAWPLGKAALWSAVAIGVVMRLCVIQPGEVPTSDYHRYLWDGGVLAHGYNPYAYSPKEVLGEETGRPVPEALRRLARESGQLARGINNPHLRTIYPPVAQGAFVLAHWLDPWGVHGWVAVVFLFDLASLLLLLGLLRTMKLPNVWVLVYWWNPLVILELFNGAHMDGIAIPFVLAALLLAVRARPISASTVLALGVGAKVWPIVLLPLILRPILGKPKQLAAALVLFGLLAGALFLPVQAGGLDEGSGFVRYGAAWENNSTAFKLLWWGSEAALPLIGQPAWYRDVTARWIAAALVAAVVAWHSRSPARGSELGRRGLWIVAAVFLLSPTQFPWYYVWLVPFLALQPRWPLVLLTPLLMIYYLRDYFADRGLQAFFNNVVVWFEFVPVWIALAWERYARRRAS